MIDKMISVKGFTLFEMLITLVLSSAVIMFAFNLYQMTQQMFVNHLRDCDFTIEYANFRFRINEEIARTEAILLQEPGVFRIVKDSNDYIIKVFDGRIIIDAGGRVDTVNLHLSKFDISFEEEEGIGNLVNGMDFHFDDHGQNYSLIFKKYYTGEQLYNWNYGEHGSY